MVLFSGCSVAALPPDFVSDGGSATGDASGGNGTGGGPTTGITNASPPALTDSEGDSSGVEPECEELDSGACPVCGNDVADAGELCDGADLGGATCETEGFAGGTLACAADCDGFDSSGCSGCGDGRVQGSEDCDGTVGDATCSDLGFGGGALACDGGCAFDTSGCNDCGDGLVQDSEVCDCGDGPCTSDQLAATVCADLSAPMNGNHTGGTLTCLADCSGFDDTDCTWCGDGSANGDELCEGDDLAGATCVDAGWLPGGGGSVGCSAGCELDGTACTGVTCGGSLAAPPSGGAACPATPWVDDGDACRRVCASLGDDACESPVQCPNGRNCEVDCSAFNSCSGHTIECAEGHGCDVSCGASSCSGVTIECPSGAPCSIRCHGFNACSSATIVCPEGNYGCDVECEGGSACSGIEIECGNGPCTMACDAAFNVCSNGTLACGSNTCEATCEGASLPNVDCGPACACQPC